MVLRDHKGMFVSSLKAVRPAALPTYDREAAKERVELLTMRTRRLAWSVTDGEWVDNRRGKDIGVPSKE